jgi:ATPase subunit of ABC transporter with duplicated ATPase domains
LTLASELEDALGTYPGAVVVASHDRWLRQRWTGTRIALSHGKIVSRTEPVEVVAPVEAGADAEPETKAEATAEAPVDNASESDAVAPEKSDS